MARLGDKTAATPFTLKEKEMPLYTWVAAPPIEEIPKQNVAAVVQVFQNSLTAIRDAPDEYGAFTSGKAGAAIDISDGIQRPYLNLNPLTRQLVMRANGQRYFGYKMDGVWAGLIHITTHVDHIEIDHVVGHAGWENAGDILIEHVLQFAPTRPAVAKLFAATEQAFRAYQKIGFVATVRGATSGGMVLNLNNAPGRDLWTRLDNNHYKLTSALNLGYATST